MCKFYLCAAAHEAGFVDLSLKYIWGGGGGAGIAHCQCVGLTVMLDAGSWVRSSSGEIFFQ